MPTLQDVAKRAGVSTATVSKVLSNTPYFTEETRLKVMQAVQELGYVPNIAARALAAGKTHIIAVVFPYVFDTIFKDPVVLLILESIEEACNQRGYNILLSTPRLQGHTPDEQYQQLIQSGYIEGVIALDNVPDASVLDIVHDRHIAAVTIGYHPSPYYVYSDDYSGGHQQMAYCLELGHRHIGIITVDADLNFSIQRRHEGMRDAAAAVGVDFDRLPQATGDFSSDSGRRGARTLLTDHPELTALLCLNDRMAIGAMRQAQEMGRTIPDDLTVLGYDNIPTAEMVIPGLTTIDQQATKSGSEAARMLFEILDNAQPESVEIPTRLVIRQSSQALDANPMNPEGR